MKRILLVGSGGREHALAEALLRDKKCELYAVLSSANPGIQKLASKHVVSPALAVTDVVRFAQEVKADWAVIGPEQPLAAGVVDELEKIGVACIGPTRALAQIETSKSFARDLLRRYGIEGSLKYKVFTSSEGLEEFIAGCDNGVVIKADGLRGGKGVKVMGDHLQSKEEAVAYAKECLVADGRVVVEEKLEGEEFSLISFVDGQTVVDTLPVQDHKRAFVGDTGPNTGGMGAYTAKDVLLPFLRREHLGAAHLIIVKAIKALQLHTKQIYKGIIYGGFMLTNDGVRLIEFNARFGDPEAMNILVLLKTSLVDIFQAIIEGKLGQMVIEFDNKASVCKYLVPQGYPDQPLKDEQIGLPDGLPWNVRLYLAAVDQRPGGLYLTGSRAVAVVGVGETIAEAEQAAEAVAKKVVGNVYHRSDIGTDELIQKRVQHMRRLRGL